MPSTTRRLINAKRVLVRELQSGNCKVRRVTASAISLDQKLPNSEERSRAVDC
jgi:hypothetical protein